MTPLPPLVVFHRLWLDNPYRRHHFWSLHAYVNDARFLCNEIKTPQPYILYWICCFPCWYGPHDTCGIGRVQSTMLRFVNFCMVWYDTYFVCAKTHFNCKDFIVQNSLYPTFLSILKFVDKTIPDKKFTKCNTVERQSVRSETQRTQWSKKTFLIHF